MTFSEIKHLMDMHIKVPKARSFYLASQVKALQDRSFPSDGDRGRALLTQILADDVNQ